MSRYTEKTDFGYQIVTEVPGDEEEMTQWAIRKLGVLEDLEDSLGCNLTQLITALRHRCVWVRLKDTDEPELQNCYLSYTCDCEGEWLSNYKDVLVLPDLKTFVYLKDYGKTWANQKEGLL